MTNITKNEVIIFNPKSADIKYRIPNSVIQVAGSIDGDYDWLIIDGNKEKDPLNKILDSITPDTKYFGLSVMPGPQLRQAIPFSKFIKQKFPHIIIIWGGYFASNQYKVVLESGHIDYVINGPGDYAFPALLKALDNDLPVDEIQNLILRKNI